MKKKWATWLSLLVLCLSIVANISHGYTVLADSLASDETMLIQYDDLLVSYKATPTQTGNAWVIHYRYHAVEDGETRRLKFQFLDPQGQPIIVVPEEGWTITKDKQLLSTFRAQDEGYVRLTTESSITKISLNVQADAQDKSGNLHTDILSKDIGKTYALTPPENTVLVRRVLQHHPVLVQHQVQVQLQLQQNPVLVQRQVQVQVQLQLHQIQ